MKKKKSKNHPKTHQKNQPAPAKDAEYKIQMSN